MIAFLHDKVYLVAVYLTSPRYRQHLREVDAQFERLYGYPPAWPTRPWRESAPRPKKVS